MLFFCLFPLPSEQEIVVRAWGRNNVGQLGDGTNSDSLSDVLVSGLSGVVKIFSSETHSLALLGKNKNTIIKK